MAIDLIIDMILPTYMIIDGNKQYYCKEIYTIIEHVY